MRAFLSQIDLKPVEVADPIRRDVDVFIAA